MCVERVQLQSERSLDFDQQVAQIVRNDMVRRQNAINRELANQMVQNLAQQIVNQPTPLVDKAIIFLICVGFGTVVSLAILLPIYAVASAVLGAAIAVFSVL